VVGLNTANQLYVYIGSVTTGNYCMVTPTLFSTTTGTAPYNWYHFAWTRDNTTNKLALWVNGIQQTLTNPTGLGTLTDTSTYYLPPTTGYNIDGGVAKYLAVGGSGYDNSPNETTWGYITNFRVSIGLCRYTTTFTPTGPFTG
jgi:hypothetical protein